MLKLCGCKEKCFVNGEKRFGYHGGTLCLYIGEEHTNGTAYSKCEFTGERVASYITQKELDNLKVKYAQELAQSIENKETNENKNSK